MPRHVPLARWYLALNAAVNSTTFTAGSTNGVLVPSGTKNEYAHVLVDSNAGCGIRVTGMTDNKGDLNIGNRWVTLADFSRPLATSNPWAEPLGGATAYKRMDVIRTDQNSNVSVNAYLGFSEHWRGV